jgi:phosphatidate cytidylyltransferase
MRHLLPAGAEKFWLVSGLIAGIGGGFGDLVMTVIRRDLGIRDYGVFIIGRGDFLQRMDRLIFVAPIYYYVMKHFIN